LPVLVGSDFDDVLVVVSGSLNTALADHTLATALATALAITHTYTPPDGPVRFANSRFTRVGSSQIYRVSAPRPSQQRAFRNTLLSFSTEEELEVVDATVKEVGVHGGRYNDLLQSNLVV